MAIIVGSAPSDMRGRAIGLFVMASHLLGDTFSPTIAGKISDSTKNLRTSMSLYPLTLVLAGAVWVVGWIVRNHTNISLHSQVCKFKEKRKPDASLPLLMRNEVSQ